MSPFTLVSVAIVAFAVLRFLSPTNRAVAAAGLATGLANPVAGVSIAFAWLSLRRSRTLRLQRLAREHAEREVEILIHSMVIGLSGGLSMVAALQLARLGLRSSLGEEVDIILRRSVQDGLTNALLTASGVAGRLFRQLGAAHLSGAPLGLALNALATENREATRARAVEHARRLPVKMVLPLSLLVLPGLLILVVGPLILPSLARIFDPYLSL